jgi:hypothetical protein
LEKTESILKGIVVGIMGKYVAYFLCFVFLLLGLEYFKIVDIPYLDLPDVQSKGKVYKEKSEENMRLRFGD